VLVDSSVLPRSYHTFRNVVSFRVNIMYYGHIGLLFDTLLQTLPNLTYLIFHQLSTYRIAGQETLPLNLEPLPRCLLVSLKSIEFQKFNCYPKEVHVVELFLKSARVLRRITLGRATSYYSGTKYMDRKKLTPKELEDAADKFRDRILERLQAFPRASADCLVKYSGP
ncbi:hypothetical protein MKW94_003162, partial [Papaver nudicaule]|nr:hypothetical protein [Papaver nudicaule]